MDLWFLAPPIIAGFLGSWLGFKAGRSYGQIDGYAQGLAAARAAESSAEQRQRDAYTAYLRLQEQKDEEKRNGS